MNTIQQLEQNELNYKIAKILYNRTPLFKFRMYLYAAAEGSVLVVVGFFINMILGMKEVDFDIYTLFFMSLVSLVVILLLIAAIVEQELDKTNFDNDKLKEALFKIKQEKLYEQFMSSKIFEKLVQPSKPITYGDVDSVYFKIVAEKKELKQKIFQQEQDRYEKLLAKTQHEYIQKYWEE